MAEYWDLLDEYLHITGKTLRRGDSVPDGYFHVVVDILSVNSVGKILITKRHHDKPFGDKWEISGGSVLAGESSIDGAIRELFEETGLSADASQLLYCGEVVRRRSRAVHHMYLYKGDFGDKDIVLQEGETVDFKLVTADELYELTKSGEFLEFQYNRIKGFFSEIIGDDVK